MLLLSALGLTYILKQGRILNEVRSFLIELHPLIKDLFSCAMCLGFWSGIFIGIIAFLSVTEILILGFATSFLGYISSILITVIEEIYLKTIEK